MIRHVRRPAAALLCGAVMLFTAAPSAGAKEKRDRQWLVDYVTQPLADTPRNRRYLAMIDRAELAGRIDHDWLKSGQQSGRGRGQATLLGQLAFAYRTPGTRWHHNAKLLEDIRAGFRGFARHQNEEGRFVWPVQQRYEYQAHEAVWRLEPLLLAYLWVQDKLPADERRAVQAMLRRGGEYLITHPLTQHNNRGAIWATGAALCGLFFADQRYDQLVAEHGPKIMAGVLAATGEVCETQGGGGPDGNYSYVGIAYAYFLPAADRQRRTRRAPAAQHAVAGAVHHARRLAAGTRRHHAQGPRVGRGGLGASRAGNATPATILSWPTWPTVTPRWARTAVTAAAG